MNVAYDDGMFDKDEQGWCSNNVRMRVEGDVVHVEQWGDANGERPYAYAWEGRITEVDEANEIILIARGKETLVFDLRSQRLLGNGVHIQDSVALLVPPTRETAAHFGALMQALFEHPGSVEVIEREGVFYGLDVGSGTHRFTARWRGDAPRSLSITAYVQADGLRDFRRRLRAWKAPILPRPSLVLRALIAEAREVGSCLSALDHGMGREAQDRIHRAGVTARALLPLVDAETAKLIRTFATNTDRWYELVEHAKSEIAMRPTRAQDAYADACVVMHLMANEATRGAAGTLAEATLRSLPEEGFASVRVALLLAQQGRPLAHEALFSTLEALGPHP